MCARGRVEGDEDDDGCGDVTDDGDNDDDGDAAHDANSVVVVWGKGREHYHDCEYDCDDVEDGWVVTGKTLLVVGDQYHDP